MKSFSAQLFFLFFLITSTNSAFALRTVGLDFTIDNASSTEQHIAVKDNTPFKTLVYHPSTSHLGPEPYSVPRKNLGENDPRWTENKFTKDLYSDKGVLVGKNATLNIGRVEYAYNTTGKISYKTSLAFLVKGVNGAADRECKLNFHVWIPSHSNDLTVYVYENNPLEFGLKNKFPENWNTYTSNKETNKKVCEVTSPSGDGAKITGEVLIKILPPQQ